MKVVWAFIGFIALAFVLACMVAAVFSLLRVIRTRRRTPLPRDRGFPKSPHDPYRS